MDPSLVMRNIAPLHVITRKMKTHFQSSSARKISFNRSTVAMVSTTGMKRTIKLTNSFLDILLFRDVLVACVDLFGGFGFFVVLIDFFPTIVHSLISCKHV